MKNGLGKIIYNSEFTESQKFKNLIKLYQELKIYDNSLMVRTFKNLTSGYYEESLTYHEAKLILLNVGFRLRMCIVLIKTH